MFIGVSCIKREQGRMPLRGEHGQGDRRLGYGGALIFFKLSIFVPFDHIPYYLGVISKRTAVAKQRMIVKND